jgi:hypothetical protein
VKRVCSATANRERMRIEASSMSKYFHWLRVGFGPFVMASPTPGENQL